LADNDKNEQGINLNINLDSTPVLYTDNILMSVNEDGVVLDIVQRVGNTNQARVVSRVGMSKNHAKKFVKALGDLVAQSEGIAQTGKKYEA
jgi:hypothetical protein